MDGGRVFRMDEIMATVKQVRDENAQLYAEADRLRGRLQESRRQCRELRRDYATASARAKQNAHYWRQMLLASVGLAVALTCLLFSLLLATAM